MPRSNLCAILGTDGSKFHPGCGTRTRQSWAAEIAHLKQTVSLSTDQCAQYPSKSSVVRCALKCPYVLCGQGRRIDPPGWRIVCVCAYFVLHYFRGEHRLGRRVRWPMDGNAATQCVVGVYSAEAAETKRLQLEPALKAVEACIYCVCEM
eukprot:5521257-Amphidinium_carterae.1